MSSPAFTLVDVLRFIPDGFESTQFPLHNAQSCWCRPRVTTATDGAIFILHKRPELGEFDC